VAAGWATSLVFALSTLTLAAALAARAAGPLAGGLAAFAVGSSPLFVSEGLAQQADVPVAALLLGAWLALLGDRSPARAALAGLLLGLLVWTKHEGWVHAAIALAAVAAARAGPFAAGIGRSRELVHLGAGLALGVLPALLQIFFWDRGRNYGVESFVGGAGAPQAAEPERWLVPARELAERGLTLPWTSVFGGALWTLLLLSAVGAVRAARGRRSGGALRLVAVAAGGTLAFWLAAFATTPYDPAWHLATALDRLILQVLPAALAAAAGWALSPDPDEPPEPERSASLRGREKTI
jgi:hypothetical protein